MSETGFAAMKIFCEKFGEQNIFFKVKDFSFSIIKLFLFIQHGLVDPQPPLGILIMPSVNK